MLAYASDALALRLSTRHWNDLARLLGCFERVVEHCARLDASREARREARRERAGRLGIDRTPERHSFEARVAVLARRIDHEIDRVTAERLREDLRVKTERQAA